MTAEELLKYFQGSLATDKKYKEFVAHAKAGKVSFQMAQEFSDYIGQKVSDAYEYTGVLRAMVTEAEARTMLQPVLTNAHSLVTEMTSLAQKYWNTANKIGMNAVTAAVDTSRIDGFAAEVATQGYDKIKDELSGQFQAFTRNGYDKTLRKNGHAMADAGLLVKYERKLNSTKDTCKNCKALAGIYTIDTAPTYFFAHHAKCACTIEPVGRPALVKNYWSKKNNSFIETRKATESPAKARTPEQIKAIKDRQEELQRIVNERKVSWATAGKIYKEKHPEYEAIGG